MPLKLLLKRTSKQYNVVSKSTFVISVELLDNGIMECTLDAESTGTDCLLNISQRLGLHQPEFFGLRYISRGVPPRQRWVELERPLKKQLEKHAQDSQLSLGVMFYVADVNLLKDEMARYHYFLQLKSDVIDGKLNCNIEQAISLAAYSLQAEFGDYDPERHTTEYLRDFAILPKELTSDDKYVGVARQYGSLVGFPPPLAEQYYIMVAQQLDGYGQETYPAKDDMGNDILICVSLNGLVIRRRDWTHVAVFRWSDIKSLVASHNKRLFVVEKAQSQRTMQFHFSDPEVAKYVRKMCILQSTFYKQNLPVENVNDNSRSHNNFSAIQSEDGTSHLGNMRATPDLIAPSLARSTGGSQYSLNNNCFTASSSSNLSSSGFNLHLLQHSSPAQQQPNVQFSSQQQQQQQQHFHHSLQELPLGRPFTPSLSLMPDLAPGSGASISTLPTNMTQQNLTPSSDDLQSIQALLPSYRQAPDYETAVQLKYGGRGMMPSSVANSTQLYFDGPSGSQNEDEPIYQNEIVSQMHSIELRDSLQKSQTVEGTIINVANAAAGLSSTTSASNPIEDTHMYMYKPPPPYPGPKLDNQGQSQQGIQSTSASLTLQNQNHHTSTVQVEGKTAKGNHSMTNEASASASSITLTSLNQQSSANTSTVTQQHRQHQQSSSVSEKVGNAVAQPQVSPSVATSFKNTSKGSIKSIGSGSSMLGISSAANAEITLSSVSSLSSSHSVGKKQLKGKTHHHDDVSSSSIASSLPATSSSSSSKMGVSASTSTTSIASKGRQSDTVVNKRDSTAKQKQPSVDLLDRNKDGKLYGKPIEAHILQEYQLIPRAKSNPNFTTALKRENSKRNRCPNVLPYEDNSIRLSPSKHNPNGYINASPVSSNISGRESKYIVGQIPLNGNAPAMWQMIWETEAKIIAVLERDSTAPFYPLDNLSPLTFNEFQISENKERSNSATIARELILTYLPKKKHRKVWVLPYEDEWKDDVPIHTEHFLCYLEEVNSIQRKVSDHSTPLPLVVLCGTGAGRSGVLILSDLLLKHFDSRSPPALGSSGDSGPKLRCDNLLAELRTQRMILVSSPSQYAFVKTIIKEYLAQSRLI